MYKVNIFSIGKTKELWLKEVLADYGRRLKPILSIHWHHPKGNSELSILLKKEPRYIVLDSKGKGMSSPEFSTWLLQTLENEGSRLTFVIGGAEGLPPEVLQRAKGQLSFSKMTFTHQMVRLLLLEQIYRAFEIDKGSPYHK